MQKIREATSDIHKNLDLLQFHQALYKKNLNPISIHSYLHCLAVLFSCLEAELVSSADERINSFWHLERAKSPLIKKDLHFLGVENKPSIAAAIEIAIELSHRISREAKRSPLFLLGVLYVTEGSQNGGVYLKQLFADCLKVSADELLYFGAYGANTSKIWTEFTAKVDSIPWTSEESEQVVAGAQFTFETLERMISTLSPFLEQGLVYHASVINPEAGAHMVPQNSEEIEIAFLAGKTAWTQYPYLAARFGERGQKFTGSDSCWLLTLYHLDRALIRKNIFWLRKLLSMRGLPSIILETHMGEILRLLRERWPERATEFLNFESVICELNTIRNAQIGAPQWHQMENKYKNSLSRCSGYLIPGAATILISAWADQASGIDGSYRATQSWLLDPDRFSQDWISVLNVLANDLGAIST